MEFGQMGLQGAFNWTMSAIKWENISSAGWWTINTGTSSVSGIFSNVIPVYFGAH